MQEILFQKGNLSPQHLDAALFLAEIAQSAGRHAGNWISEIIFIVLLTP